jgi:hypothetical protein
MVLPIEQSHDPTKERHFEDPASTTPWSSEPDAARY